jgi:ketosteroid isomerase-like protein
MSEQDNVERVQRFYKALFAGDIPATLDMAAEDIEILIFGSTKIPWTGPRRGRHELERNLRMITEGLEFQVFQMDEFILARDSVVILGHERQQFWAVGKLRRTKLKKWASTREKSRQAEGESQGETEQDGWRWYSARDFQGGEHTWALPVRLQATGRERAEKQLTARGYGLASASSR